MTFDEFARVCAIGFAASVEGYNAECPYDHLAPAADLSNYRHKVGEYDPWKMLNRPEFMAWTNARWREWNAK